VYERIHLQISYLASSAGQELYSFPYFQTQETIMKSTVNQITEFYDNVASCFKRLGITVRDINLILLSKLNN